MDPTTIGLICLVVLMVLIFTGLPVAFCMLLVGIIGLSFLRSPEAAFQVVASDLFQSFSSYTMSIVPLFGLMGFLASYSGIGSSLFNAADKFIGHRRGGIAAAVQVACAGFGAICGSIPATIATMGTVAYPEMKARNYDPRLSTASIAAGASLSVLIPPSSTMIIYGIAAEQSIGRLFIAGIIPGILLMFLYMGAVFITVKRHPNYSSTTEKATWRARFHSLAHGGILEILVVFLITIGGMFIGVFTPTEAASIGAIAMLLVCIIERKINIKGLIDALISSTKLAAMVMILIGCASIFGRMFTMTGIPRVLATFVDTMDLPGWIVISFIVIIYFILGIFIDELCMILITIPIFFPIVVTNLGYDPVWFGVMLILVMTLGGLSPPMGMNVFVMKAFAKEVPIMTIFAGVWPFIVALLVGIILIIAFPPLTYYLPNLIMGT